MAAHRLTRHAGIASMLALAALTAGCTGGGHADHTSARTPAASASSSAGSPNSTPGQQTSQARAVKHLAFTGQRLDVALIDYHDKHHRYPATVQLRKPHSLTLTAPSQPRFLIDDDRINSDVTLAWYRPYPDRRLDQTGGRARGAYSYCMSAATSHRRVTGDPTVASVAQGKGTCPTPPRRRAH